MVLIKANQPHNPSSGFSLTEIMMQLVILTTVSIPLIMMLNTQRLQIESNRNDVVNQVLAAQLFDNLVLQHPDPIDAYTVSTRQSIHCDPATRLKSAADYTATCTGPGADVNKGPFFTRTLAYSNNNRNLRVTIALFKSTLDPSPYYELSREYLLDTFRINAGLTATNATINTPSTSDFGNMVVPDSAGNLWYPMYYPGTAPANAENNTFYVTNSGGCTLSATTPAAAAEAPFTTALSYNRGSCANGLIFYFPNVVAKETYDVKVYLMPDPASPTTCVANSTGTSCDLVDVLVEGVRPADNNTWPIVKQSNFDTVAAVGGPGIAGKGVVFTTQVTLPPTASAMRVTVRPAGSGAVGGTPKVQLSGVEIIRRSDTNV